MPIPPVLIEFATKGVADVSRAFDTIERRMIRAEEEMATGTERGSRRRVRVSKEEAEARERAIAGVTTAATRSETAITREAERESGVRERASERATRVAEREAKKKADTEIREAERARKAQEREHERLENYKRQVQLRSAAAAGRAVDEEMRAADSAKARFGRGIGGAVTRGTGHILGSAASLAGGALAIGGGFALADIAGRELQAQRSAALLVNTVTTGATPPAGANVGNILGAASQVSRETGMGKEELIAGTLEYARKARGGDFAGAMANMGFFAKMSKTTGAGISEIASAAGILQSQNESLTKDPAAMRQMLLDVYAQGKAGSMSMVDVAKQIGILASTRSSYAGDQAHNQRTLLALGQLAAPEGTVEEAGTFIKNIAAEAATHRKSTKQSVGLEQMGVKFDQFGRMESPEQMVEAVFRHTKGDLTQMEKVFGIRGMPLFRSLLPAFTGAGGGEAGIKAVHEKMASVTGATMTTADLDKQFAQLMTTPAERFQRSLNELSEVVGARVEPIMGRLADMLERNRDTIDHFMTGLLDVAEWLIANPWKGLGVAVTASIAKEIGSAAVGQGIASALATKIGAGGGIIAAAAAITITGMAVIDWLAKQDVHDQQNKIGSELVATNVMSNTRANIRAGRVSAKDVANVDRALADQEAAMKRQEEGSHILQKSWSASGGFVNFPALMQAMGFDEAGAARHKMEVENATRTLKELERAAKQVHAAFEAVASTHVDPARNTPIAGRP